MLSTSNVGNYDVVKFGNGDWVVVESGRNWKEPKHTHTFAFDTETFAYLDGKKMSQEAIFEALYDVEMAEKRQRLSTSVWAWQCYDEYNGFFMTNSFDKWLLYQCRCGYGNGWCYNAKFDFSQIDWQILAEQKDRWTRHKRTGRRGESKGQAWTYESCHNDMGARYAYKLWIPYKHKDRHTYTHAVEFRDFMNLFVGGLARCLESLDVEDNDGNKVRKLTMEYQNVDTDNLTEAQINYCCNDVKGLYFAVKKYNTEIEAQSDGECHCFGEETNLMTAGGFAKKELLRSLYPELLPKKRLKAFQKAHPMTAQQDKWLRDNHLYRGGISFVNPRYKGRMLLASEFGEPMRRYDVNSEYPYAMSVIHDLVGNAIPMPYSDYIAMPLCERNKYECIMILESVTGVVRDGYLPFWYDPFKRDFVDVIDEHERHLMFEVEFDEMQHYYDMEYSCENVLLYKRGERIFEPYVTTNYALKATAKKEKNGGKQTVVKLKLNSAYGKLAERVVRQTGYYEYNEETGAIHYVADGEEVDESACMSVALGALVTATARVWILSHIREICKEEQMSKLFVYIDTDSIHAFASYDKADPYELGGFKLEAECEAVKYIAPKTYVDIERVRDGYVELNDIEIHTKGVNVMSVRNDFQSVDLTLDYIDKRFNYGEKFNVLCAMNVHGGKVLCPTAKFLARYEQAPDETFVVTYGYNENMIMER